MSIITITSDWNEDDYYVASLKGKVLSRCPEVRIVDISHRVKPFNTAQAAFLVRNSYRHFPAGSIHIVAVNSEPGADGQLLAALVEEQYFLCADNGLLGLLGDPAPGQVVSLRLDERQRNSSFVALSVFAEAACHLAGGGSLDALGENTDTYDRQVPMRPTVEENILLGSVIYVDSFQNAITNISREYFHKLGQERDFRIYVQSKHYMIEEVHETYQEVPEGEMLALWNSLDLLEIAIRGGNAAGLLNLRTGSTIRVEFNKEEAHA
jgi:S-adenosylmethionine hydrolase